MVVWRRTATRHEGSQKKLNPKRPKTLNLGLEVALLAVVACSGAARPPVAEASSERARVALVPAPGEDCSWVLVKAFNLIGVYSKIMWLPDYGSLKLHPLTRTQVRRSSSQQRWRTFWRIHWGRPVWSFLFWQQRWPFWRGVGRQRVVQRDTRDSRCRCMRMLSSRPLTLRGLSCPVPSATGNGRDETNRQIQKMNLCVCLSSSVF